VVRTEQTRETDAEKGADIDLRSFISDFNVLSAEAANQWPVQYGPPNALANASAQMPLNHAP
jgi:hypothetical protein